MNTNKLKKFAQETRRKLLKQVNGKLEHVLTAETGELREKAHIIKDLKKDLDRMGRDALVDKVAYTWFNRFVALRYMDVRGFQPLEVSVLTPKEGQVSPEILQEAMAGHIPDDLNVDRQKVMDLLDGRIESSNAENEAFRLLLVAVCNHLHDIFPFLFERIDDYSELLLPDDLTSEFSIVQDVIDGMVDEDCQEVEVLGWLYQFYISEKKDEVFASKEAVKKEDIPAATQLFTPRWIVKYMVQNTVGKLWVLNHPNSKLKEQMPYYIESEVKAEDVLTIDKPEELSLLDQACGSGHILVYGFVLLYKIYEEEGYAPSDIPRLIIENNLHGFEIDERASQLAGLAILMKAREYQRRFFRISNVPEPNITCFKDLMLCDEEIIVTLKNSGVEYSDELLDDFQNMKQATNFGSLIIPHASLKEIQKTKEACEGAMATSDLFDKKKLTQLIIALETLNKLGTKVSCVVINPPYMNSGNMNSELSKFVKSEFKQAKFDLITCFIMRAHEQLNKNGHLGMISWKSWMFLGSFDSFRKWLLESYQIECLIHLGRGIFGSDYGTVAFELRKSNREKREGIFKKLYNKHVEVRSVNKIESLFHSGGYGTYKINQNKFKEIAGYSISYWISERLIKLLKGENLGEYLFSDGQILTGDNDQYLRYLWETKKSDIQLENWKLHTKGGLRRKWSGNIDRVVKWDQNTREYYKKDKTSRILSEKYWNKSGIVWNGSGADFGARYLRNTESFNKAAPAVFIKDDEYDEKYFLGLLNSIVTKIYLKLISSSNYKPISDILKIPIFLKKVKLIESLVKECIEIAEKDWNKRLFSWDFKHHELIRFNKEGGIETLEEAYDHYKQYWQNKFYQLHQNEEELNREFIEIYGLEEELTTDVPLNEITILQEELDSKKLKKLEKEWRENSKSQISNSKTSKPALPFKDKEVMAQFLSYAVGCMFGRYSLDEEGLILANQGETLEDYLQKVSLSKNEVTFLPDDDNIIPVLDDEWFEDDIVARFHEFLKASFGASHFQKNLQFVEEMLGHDVRKYFDKYFYKDHYKRYNKRPIYWKFSSPKGSFNVLIYMHRYTPDTLNNILNNYLREFINKLKTQKEQMQHLENTGSASEKARASKEIDKINTMIKDCEEYEREILYPLASERIEIDLDDGVLVNYNLFGKAVEEIKSVNDKKKKKKVKEFDWIDGGRIR